MTEQHRQGVAGADALQAGEQDRLIYALETRFAPSLEAAAAAVREAERAVEEARARLARAEEAASRERYRSDALVFMRATLEEEVEGLDRKTTPKKVRAAYRFLVDRAAELAAAEVQGFRDDQASARYEREHGVEACRAAQQQAEDSLAEGRQMQEQVRSAERAARRGLDVMLDKLTAYQQS